MKRTIMVAALAIKATAIGPVLPQFYWGPETARSVPTASVSAPKAEGIANTSTIDGILVDINGDGKHETIHKINNCGTGGCSFFIYDGASSKRVCEIFGGRIFVSKTMLNGWPVLEVYVHRSASSGTVETYVHDGNQYTLASTVQLYEKSAEEFFKKYDSVKQLQW